MIELQEFANKDKLIFSIKDSLLLVATVKSSSAFTINIKDGRVLSEFKLRDKTLLNLPITENTCNCPIDLSNDLQSMDFYKENQIVLQTEQSIKFINTKGETLESINLNDNLKSQKFLYSNIYEVPILYNAKKNTISVFKYCYKCYERTKKYYSPNIQTEITIDNKAVYEDSVFYPEIYRKCNWGYLNDVYRSRYEDNQLFTFNPDHRIYVYNSATQITGIHDGASAYSSNTINILSNKESKDELLMHLISSDHYRRIVFDPISHNYFRLFSTPKYINKELQSAKLDNYIQIFNQEFDLISEVKIPKISINNYFAYGGKLYWISAKDNQLILFNYTFAK